MLISIQGDQESSFLGDHVFHWKLDFLFTLFHLEGWNLFLSG